MKVEGVGIRWECVLVPRLVHRENCTLRKIGVTPQCNNTSYRVEHKIFDCSCQNKNIYSTYKIFNVHIYNAIKLKVIVLRVLEELSKNVNNINVLY